MALRAVHNHIHTIIFTVTGFHACALNDKYMISETYSVHKHNQSNTFTGPISQNGINLKKCKYAELFTQFHILFVKSPCFQVAKT